MYYPYSTPSCTLPPYSNRFTSRKFFRESSQQQKATSITFPSQIQKPGTTTKRSNSGNQGVFNWVCLLVLFFSLTLPAMAGAAKVDLAWDYDNITQIAGFHMFQRTEGQAYDYNTPVWTGTTTSCTIDDLTAGSSRGRN